jgi:hypothetical protein
MDELAGVVRTQLNSFFGVDKIYNIKLDINSCKKCKGNAEVVHEDFGGLSDAVKTEPGNNGRTISLKSPAKKDSDE